MIFIRFIQIKLLEMRQDSPLIDFVRGDDIEHGFDTVRLYPIYWNRKRFQADVS